MLHCHPLLATRQEMLLNSHVQTPESKDMRHSPKEVGGSSGNAGPEMDAVDSPVSVSRSDAIEGLEIFWAISPKNNIFHFSPR